MGKIVKLINNNHLDLTLKKLSKNMMNYGVLVLCISLTI